MVLLETRAQRCPPAGPAHTCPPEPPGQRTGQPRGPFLPREQVSGSCTQRSTKAHLPTLESGARLPVCRGAGRRGFLHGACGGNGHPSRPKRPAGSEGGEAEGFRIAPRVSCAEQASSEFTHGSPDPPQLRCDCV